MVMIRRVTSADISFLQRVKAPNLDALRIAARDCELTLPQLKHLIYHLEERLEKNNLNQDEGRMIRYILRFITETKTGSYSKEMTRLAEYGISLLPEKPERLVENNPSTIISPPQKPTVQFVTVVPTPAVTPPSPKPVQVAPTVAPTPAVTPPTSPKPTPETPARVAQPAKPPASVPIAPSLPPLPATPTATKPQVTVAQLQEHGNRLLRELNFISTIFYPDHVMPALIKKAASLEELDQWHAVASRKIAEVKRRKDYRYYSEFKYGPTREEMIKGAEGMPQHWCQAIKQAKTPQEFASLLPEWHQQHPHWHQLIERAETPQQLDSLISEWQQQHHRRY
jgi:outer membrane biosynthesis protein TonB